MARIYCAISGLSFSCEHGPLTILPEDGYFHPMFALPYKKLYTLYSKHCNGELTETDSYLLFLAFLHSTDQVHWNRPVTAKPRDSATIALIENNIHQLIRVIELTGAITIPSFKQPSFSVNKDNCSLEQIPNWILAWENNITAFRENYASQRTHEDLVKLENRIQYFLSSGTDPKSYATLVANWANKAAEFPYHKEEYWCKIIRSCFNDSKMFSTPIADIREVKEYCEQNIEAGSIYFHALMSTLREGSARHTNFLGLGSTASNSLGYTLLPSDTTKDQTEVEAIIAKAPVEAPIRADYESDLAFIRAKLRYRVAITHKKSTSNNTGN